MLFFVLLAFLVLYALDVPWLRLGIPLPPWLRWAGFALGVASLAWWAWTQAALGAQWSAQLQLREEHRLVTTGPYARVRHPLYTAMVGIAIAFALVTAHWVFVAFGIVSVAGLFSRVPRGADDAGAVRVRVRCVYTAHGAVFPACLPPRKVNMPKIKLESENVVAETLLIALYARALEARQPVPLIRDDAAAALVEQIDYDFARGQDAPSRPDLHDDACARVRPAGAGFPGAATPSPWSSTSAAG